MNRDPRETHLLNAWLQCNAAKKTLEYKIRQMEVKQMSKELKLKLNNYTIVKKC